MSIFSAFKDRVLDKFGVLDDAQDYVDKIDGIMAALAGKAKAAQKLMTMLRDRVENATLLTDFSSGEYRQALAIVRDLQDEMESIRSDLIRISKKAEKDPELWPVLRGKFASALRTQTATLSKIDRAFADLAIAERTHKEALKELAQEREEHRDPDKAKRTIVRRITTSIGVLGGLILALSVTGF